MKLKRLITCLTAALLTTSAAYSQTTLAKWTFETSYTSITGTAASITNIAAEVGTGTASGKHVSASTVWSALTGNGSAKCFSADHWAQNDYSQFAVSSTGFQNLTVAYDQTISATGPRDFALYYSTDGVNFTEYGSTYVVLTNSTTSNNEGTGKTTATWISGTYQSVYNFSNDLSSVSAINNQSVVYFRLVCMSASSGSGGAIGTSGSCRVDNFTVTGVSLSSAPSIVSQPAGLNIYKGDSASFSVTAGGTAPLAFQWYYTNSSGAVKLIDGSSGYGFGTITNSTNAAPLTLSYVDPAQAGGYFVVITNVTGAITSSVANLTVGIRTPIATTIYAIRTNQTANWTPADTTNLYTVTGTVYTLFNMTAATSREFYIEDASGEGIPVFVGGGSFTMPNPGDSVTVTGPIGQYNGLLEFNLSASNPTHSFTINSSGNPLPTPKYFNLASLTNIAFVETNIEGSLVVVSNVFLQQPFVAGFVGAANVVMTNAAGVKLNLFVNAGASDVIASPVPRFASSIVGLFGQYTTASPATNSYEVDILQYASLTAGTPVTANPDSYAMLSNTASLFPVLVNDTVLSPLYEGALTVTAVSTTNGTAGVDGTGTNITFTPDTDFVGTLTIGYTATDAAGYSSNGVVTVTVTNLPSGPTTIVPTVPPAITAFNITGGNLVITGTNAQATGVYYLLSSTNVALPLSQWTPVSTNVVSTANGFTFIGTNVVTPGNPQQFYILSSTNNR
jgi:Bacterial Ig domain/Immunoglobulin I-set domain